MQAIRAKLNSRRGASILLALLVFLICAMAGMGALTAASSNLGRYRYAEEEEQAYLAVSSAARLVAEALQQSTYEVKYTKVETGTTEPAWSSIGSSKEYTDICTGKLSDLKDLLGKDLLDLVKKKNGDETRELTSHKVSFKLGDILPPVTAEIQLTSEIRPGELTGTFWVEKEGEEKELYKTELTVEAKLEKTDLGVSDSEPGEGGIVTRTTKQTYTLTWHTATFTPPEKKATASP